MAQVDNWQSMDLLTVLDVLIDPNAAALVDGNSLVKTQGKSDATSLLTQRGIDKATVSVLKLLMIIPMYARFSMLRWRLMRLNGQTIDCYLLPFLTLRVTLAYLAYMSMSCLTQERGWLLYP